MTGRPAPYYKVLAADQTPHHGGTGKWVKKRWRTVDGPLVPCVNGIHFCRRDQLIQWLGPSIWLFEDGSPDETVDAGDKMVTRRGRIMERVDVWNDVTARLFAADCAEAVLYLIPESHRPPFAKAVSAARAFARGDITNSEREAAGAAAWAAARAAARDAARAAARDAAWATAWDAAEGAARAAAMAAAWAASGAAAWAAARAAARDAAWAAAGAAAEGAARDAARAAQTDLLFEYLEGKRL